MRSILVRLLCNLIPVKAYRQYLRTRFAVNYRVEYNVQQEAVITKFPNGRNCHTILLKNGVRFLHRNYVSRGVKIGRYSYLNAYSRAERNTVIGRYCSIGHHVILGAGEHPTHFLSTSPAIYQNRKTNRWEVAKQTCIGNDVWIGSNAVIKYGVKVGDGAIIGAGAVVVKDVAPYAIVGGVPARLICYRFEKETIEKLWQTAWWQLPHREILRLPFTSVSAALEQLTCPDTKLAVFIIPNLQGAGAERVVLNLCRGLQKYENCRCHILCFSARRDYKISSDIPIHILSLPKRKWGQNYRKKCAAFIDSYILEHIGRPQAVFVNITQAIKNMKYSRLPVYNIVHCPPSMEYLLYQHGIKRWLRRRHVEIDYSFHPSICVSHGCAIDFRRNFCISQPIGYIYNPIERDEICKEANYISSHMQQEIEQLGAYIIHVGSFKEAKDHDCLIRAYAKAGINEKLVLLGQPSGQPAFLQHAQALVKELQLQDKVIFKGFIKNPFPYIKQAKLFVLSSKYEGFGMVLAEAIALRTPVVSTDCPAGPAEIVGPDFARVLSPVGDIDALAANIKNSLLHPARYTVLLRECFTTREVCRQYMKIINEGIVGIPTV